MARSRRILDIPFHLFTGAYLTESVLHRLKTEDPDLIVVPGTLLTPEQKLRKKQYTVERVKKMMETRERKRQEIEKIKMGIPQQKELAAAIEESPEKLNKVGKKLYAMGFDIVTELVVMVKSGKLKNHEKIKVLEMLLEFSETRNKAADAAPPEGGFNFSVNVISNFQESKPAIEVQITKVEDGAAGS